MNLLNKKILKIIQTGTISKFSQAFVGVSAKK